jgi:N-acyl-D-amino-acid deacylase
MKADVVVFDPQRIRDRATIEDPGALSEGMIHVLVNGIPVLENERFTGERPGIGLRRHLRSIG